VIEHGRKADRAQEDCIESRQLRDTVFGHHRAGFEITFATPVEMFEFERNIKARRERFEDLDTLGNDFHANAVTRDGCDPVITGHA